MRQASETLAGRVAYLDMGPVDMTEAHSAGLPEHQLWLRGGFPDSLLAADDARSFDWRQDFIRSYLERDVPMFAPRLPAQTLGRLWTMLAHQQGGQLNQARLAASLGVSEPTVGRYIDLLCDLHLTRRLTLVLERGGRAEMAIANPHHHQGHPARRHHRAMPETTFHIPSLTDQDAADAVMFVLHDLPCIHQADVNLPERSAWVSHSTMIAAEDIATALAEAGFDAQVRG
jgi:DNA-binding Lrp family transcriptional regulator